MGPWRRLRARKFLTARSTHIPLFQLPARLIVHTGRKGGRGASRPTEERMASPPAGPKKILDKNEGGKTGGREREKKVGPVRSGWDLSSYPPPPPTRGNFISIPRLLHALHTGGREGGKARPRLPKGCGGGGGKLVGDGRADRPF